MEPRCFSQQDETIQVERWIPSTCGMCSIGCGIDVGVAGAHIAGVRGRADHPVNQGRLGPKGLEPVLREPPSEPGCAPAHSEPVRQPRPCLVGSCDAAGDRPIQRDARDRRARRCRDLQQRTTPPRGVLHDRQDRARWTRHRHHRREYTALHRDHGIVVDGIVRRGRPSRCVRGLRSR